MTSKQLMAAGWRHPAHFELLFSDYRARVFKDLIELSEKLDFTQFRFFYRTLKPLDDDIQGQLDNYWAVIKELEGKKDESGELKVHAKELMKIADDL
jgi:hypothetical protein